MSVAGDPKKQIVELLQRHYDIRRVAGQSIFDVNSKAELYIRYSKDLGGGKFFFGVGEQEFLSRSGHNLFVLLVCGAAEKVVVIPADVLKELVAGVRVAHGQWKLNIFSEGPRLLLQLAGKGKFDVSEFSNYFDFTPREYTRGYTPQIRLHVPPAPRKERLEPRRLGEEPRTLEEKLQTTSRDSDNPDKFERALQEFFTELGLKARLIGGPGETDILVETPKRIVVDGKSTKLPSLSHVNFTRIKQHKLANDAEAMLIVSVGFQPALVRDAMIEEAGLVTVETLLTLLGIHRALPMSPLQYAQLFGKSGLISDEHLAGLEAELEACRNWLEDASRVLENMDFEPRSVDEIKGRTDVNSQQTGSRRLSAEQITEALAVMAREPFNTVSFRHGRYSLRFHPEQARERFKAILRLAHEP